jgi:protease II
MATAACEISPSGKTLAISIDTVGHEEHQITIIQIAGGHQETTAKHYETMIFLDDDNILFDVADHLGVPK